MKNRIDACFEKLKAENKKALVTFITAGDPDMDTTEKCVLEMYKNGSDIIEIGVPFSDPIAEGATIRKLLCVHSVVEQILTRYLTL